MGSAAYWSDDSEWPLVKEGMSGTIDDATLDRYFATLAGYLGRGERYAVLFDARAARGMPAVQRRRLSERLAVHREQLRTYHAAIAIVTRSPIIAGLVTAVYWLAPPPYAYRVFADDLPAAEAWVRAQLA